MNHLGTVLMVWAHPDDETYLAGGMSAALTDAGHRVVCVTATRGEAGVSGLPTSSGEELARIRTAELEEALAVLGVQEHYWLDYPDGGCRGVDAEEAGSRVAAVLDAVRADTVVTFGPDGFTGHPDHRTVSRWTDVAIRRASRRPRLLHAVATEKDVDWDIAEEFGVYELGRPRVCREDEVDVQLRLEGRTLDRKVDALLRQVSQTRDLAEAIGPERFRAWVSGEAFAVPRPH